MSDQMTNAPLTPAAPNSIFQNWINALTKPNEQTYREIASSPNAKASTAFLWIFICSLVQSFFAILVQGSLRSTLAPFLEKYGLGNNLPAAGFGSTVIRLICGAPIAAVIVVVVLVIIIALIQWIAKMFGGQGTFDQLAFAFGSIIAPSLLVSSVLVLLGAIPFVGLCFSVISLFFSLYILVLEIFAVKGVHQVGWGGAVGAVLIPFAAILLFCCCILAVLFSVAGAALGNVLSTINQSLQP